MAEENVVNTQETATPAQETTPVQTTTPPPADSGNAVKEIPLVAEDRLDKHPRFKEVIHQKNEYQRKAQELERQFDDYKRQYAPKEADPFADLAPEEREQTKKFIDKYVAPEMEKRTLEKFAPFIQEMQNEKLNKQVTEAKALASKVGLDFDERLPEIVDYLSRPENKGRLTAKEALISLYADEMLDSASRKGKDEVSKEQKELMEKKKLANMQVGQVNPNVAIQTDALALKGMDARQRQSHNIQKAIELARQGVKSPKVKFD
jgi:hypothetical protein